MISWSTVEKSGAMPVGAGRSWNPVLVGAPPQEGSRDRDRGDEHQRARRQVVAEHRLRRGPHHDHHDERPVPPHPPRGVRRSRLGPQGAEHVPHHLTSVVTPRHRPISRKHETETVPSAGRTPTPWADVPAVEASDRGATDPHPHNGAHDDSTPRQHRTGRPASIGERKARRSVDKLLVVASVYVPVSMFNTVGESWTYYYGLSVGLEVIVLAAILRTAWTWPRTASPATSATSLDREAVRIQQRV